MKPMTAVFLTASAALIFAACGAPPANNTPANTNANTTKAAPTVPTGADMLAMDKQANDAYFKGDSKYFETFLSDKFGWSEKGKHMTKADVLKEITANKCDMKTFALDDPQTSKIDDDTYVLTYKGTFDGTCTENGKSTKVPSPIRAGTVFVRNGDKWQAAWHGETPIIEPKKDDKLAATDTKKTDTKVDTKKADSAADATDAPKPVAKPEPKKEEPKKEEPKKDDKTAPAANAAAPTAESKPDANTDALVKLETAGWDAWKDKNAKALDDMSAKNLAVIDPAGMWFGNRADVLKSWDGSNCKDVKNVNVKDGFAWALSPTVEILSFDATADGSCDGMKNGTTHGTSVYIKEGDAWKIAFEYLSPAGKM